MSDNWSNNYLLDIPIIDEQHRLFFELWENECNNVSINDLEKLKELINKLESYLINHFNTEEELMKKANVSDYDNHVSQHRYFIKKIDELKLEFDYANVMLFENIVNFMKKWFLSHILQTDKLYKESVHNYLTNLQ